MSDQLQSYYSLVTAELGKLVQSLHSLREDHASASSTLITRLLEESCRSLCEEIAQINLKMSNLNLFVTSLRLPHSVLSLTGPRQLSPEDWHSLTNGLTGPSQLNGDREPSSSSTALRSYPNSAFNWARGLNPSAKDPRQWFYSAQQAVENTISLITSTSFNTDVLIIAHVQYQDRPDGTMKGYPSAVGKALGPTIPAYFENVALAQTIGGKRLIQTVPTALIDLKNPAAFKMPASLPIETGLQDFFTTLKGQPMNAKT